MDETSGKSGMRAFIKRLLIVSMSGVMLAACVGQVTEETASPTPVQPSPTTELPTATATSEPTPSPEPTPTEEFSPEIEVIAQAQGPEDYVLIPGVEAGYMGSFENSWYINTAKFSGFVDKVYVVKQEDGDSFYFMDIAIPVGDNPKSLSEFVKVKFFLTNETVEPLLDVMFFDNRPDTQYSTPAGPLSLNEYLSLFTPGKMIVFRMVGGVTEKGKEGMIKYGYLKPSEGRYTYAEDAQRRDTFIATFSDEYSEFIEALSNGTLTQDMVDGLELVYDTILIPKK